MRPMPKRYRQLSKDSAPFLENTKSRFGTHFDTLNDSVPFPRVPLPFPKETREGAADRWDLF